MFFDFFNKQCGIPDLTVQRARPVRAAFKVLRACKEFRA